MLIRIPKPWHNERQTITPESVYFNRRKLLKGMAGAGLGLSIAPLLGCNQASTAIEPGSELGQTIQQRPALRGLNPNPLFAADTLDRPVTEQVYASSYNNFYEFGGTKEIWRNAQRLPLDGWTVEVGGLVNNPRTYDLDDIKREFNIEERVYRFRCVEAWAMVVPWAGFPMRELAIAADPQPAAKFVKFQSYYDAEIATGPAWPPSAYMPWPYTEGLRLDEMMNETAFFAIGIYGRELPKQHGAPIRMVVPWKYGYKGAKSIVKIEFTDQQPATFWNTEVPSEYGFEANVNPAVPHPRWSQAEERIVGSGKPWDWNTLPTLPYNGYGEFVAELYA